MAATLCATHVRADQFQTLWSFTGGEDGSAPLDGLVRAGDGALYGTTSGGGSNGYGTIFKITTNGVLTSVWHFTGADDGESPSAGLVQASDGALYGSARYGGSNAAGVVFRFTTNGILSPLWSFTYGDDGGYPYAKLLQAGDGALYGTASGGSNSLGAVFRITTNGALTPLWSFTGGANGEEPAFAGLVQASDGALYGTTRLGGIGHGTIFKIPTNGVMTPLWSFAGTPDGRTPQAGLIQASDGLLYGTTFTAGTNGPHGTIFKITTNGVLTPVWHFTGGADGRMPEAELLQASDGALYGTTTGGGATFAGVLFRITLSGALTSVWSFTAGSDGSTPQAALIQVGNALFGTTSTGGTNGNGTVFRLALDSLQSSGYAAWAAAITNGMTNFNESATGDGYPNLLKYFTGSSPTNPDTLARLTASLSNGIFDLRLNRNTSAVDAIAIAEGSYTLDTNATWIGIATNVNGSWGGATNVTETGAGTPIGVTVKDTAPFATNRFLRVRVLLPPP